MSLIRPATKDDIKDIAEVYVETWRSTYAGTLPDKVLIEMSQERQMIMWARAIDRARNPKSEKILVVDEADGVVGVGSAGFNRNREGPARDIEYGGEVYTLYVLPDFQNQGLGELLLKGLFHVLVSQDYHSAVIWVLALNPSRFFYEAMGGKRVGERDEKLWGTTLKEFAYGWDDLRAAVE
ncbi:MAG: GNAT family N-acetyltransferase [Rhodospirillaceae bacterium]|nr:GNAT family N-acetyltransferase [Rhodospirillaceae bacterium]|tara:strand:+ start:462 stop:1004 length:543 start_codon:yes stop_codon:yes gene_type:complete